MPATLSLQRISEAYEISRRALLAQRTDCGYWTGELSTSALSTATAVMALEMVRRNPEFRGGRETRFLQETGFLTRPHSALTALSSLIDGGLAWLAGHQNEDGGWGDTTKSRSNISTTMLAHAVFHATGTAGRYASAVDKATGYIDRGGGVSGVIARYGKDRTFSAPILTHCALAGLVDWDEVIPLPFELACLPARFYKTVRLPVVSYALPALIAVGQVHHHHRPCGNPLLRMVRKASVGRSLKVLDRIQPTNGGFLEATPLTSFVTMSLAGMGRADHPVAQRGLQFLIDSVRPDGSWPIDTNLATWVTTLSVNALGEGLAEEDRPAIRDWLLAQQYREVHPYTNADPGGWAWTDLPGGVPDVDDTSGAILALLRLGSPPLGKRGKGAVAPKDNPGSDIDITPPNPPFARGGRSALEIGVKWLLDLQNRDGGWPTFCRGWGNLPFDRSAPDLTAHALRALIGWFGTVGWAVPTTHPGERTADSGQGPPDDFGHNVSQRIDRAIGRGFRYLEQTQRADGSWLPLWFGNQHGSNDANPTYGTARVLAAYRYAGRLDTPPARRGLAWLEDNQNADGGWGGAKGIESSVEETALAVDALLSVAGPRVARPDRRERRGSLPTAGTTPFVDSGRATPNEVLSDESPAGRGLGWLLERVEAGSFQEPSPIGFYFAKLWYFEHLYPLIFTVGALGRACRTLGPQAGGWSLPAGHMSSKSDAAETGGPGPPDEFQQGARRVDCTQ